MLGWPRGGRSGVRVLLRFRILELLFDLLPRLLETLFDLLRQVVDAGSRTTLAVETTTCAVADALQQGKRIRGYVKLVCRFLAGPVDQLIVPGISGSIGQVICAGLVQPHRYAIGRRPIQAGERQSGRGSAGCGPSLVTTAPAVGRIGHGAFSSTGTTATELSSHPDLSGHQLELVVDVGRVEDRSARSEEHTSEL